MCDKNKSLKIPKGNQNPEIKEGSTIQWQRDKRSTKHHT